MSFAAWAHSHARSILFLLGALALAGAVASFSLPVSLFPQVSFPRVRITLDAGDRPAEQMTVEVTTPVEEAVRAIPGVRNLRSTTSRGTSEISVNFNWGEDMISAMLQCQSQVNKILPSLPPGSSFEFSAPIFTECFTARLFATVKTSNSRDSLGKTADRGTTSASFSVRWISPRT